MYNRVKYSDEMRSALQRWADHVDKITHIDDWCTLKLRFQHGPCGYSCEGFSNEAKDEKANSAHSYAYPSHCYVAARRSGNFRGKDSITNRGTWSQKTKAACPNKKAPTVIPARPTHELLIISSSHVACCRLRRHLSATWSRMESALQISLWGVG
jgi:hypothetical protein